MIQLPCWTKWLGPLYIILDSSKTFKDRIEMMYEIPILRDFKSIKHLLESLSNISTFNWPFGLDGIPSDNKILALSAKQVVRLEFCLLIGG